MKIKITESQLKNLKVFLMKEVTEITEDENPCWDGYEQIGMKEKDGKQVPNCVPKTNEGDVNLKELDMDTYAKQMYSTADYGWTTYLSKDDDKYSNPKHKGNKEARVNKLSRERFENAFYKQYPQKSVKLNSNVGPLTFITIAWEANYTNYYLNFEVDNYNNQKNYPKYIVIKYDGTSGLYINQKGVELESESISKAQGMLKYNLAARTNGK